MQARLSHGDLSIGAAGLGMTLLVYLGCRPWDLHDGLMIGAPFGRDFVNFWMGGRLALTGSLATLTDFAAYNDLLAATFVHTRGDSLLFSYPPHALLALAPLAMLPYALALAVWTTLNLLAVALAVRRLVPRHEALRPAIMACLSPAVLTMVLYGHFGGLLGIALTVVVLDGERRPVVAGLCLAALTTKPQLAMVVGLILLGAGRWRCLPVAALATLALVAASLLAFGVAPWRGFVFVTLPEQGRLLTDGVMGMLRTTISIYHAARLVGLPSPVAWLAQIGVGVAALGIAIATLRRDGDRAKTLLVVGLAAVVALPYANHYDLAIVAAPATVLLFRDTGAVRLPRLAAWLAPPLAWHFAVLGLPVEALVYLGNLLDERADAPAAALASSPAPA